MKNKSRSITANDIGCIIDASCDSADSLNLETIALARSYGAKLGRLPGQSNPDRSQILSEMADSAVDHLNSLELPSYCAFYFEDNSLFFLPDLDSAKESVEFTSSKEQDFPDADFRGEWLHVSDHGNATLYVRTDAINELNGALVRPLAYSDKEIWAIV